MGGIIQWQPVGNLGQCGQIKLVSRQLAACRRPALGLDVSIILPQRLLDRVAERAPREPAALAEIDGIRRWRIEALGQGIVDALVS